MTVVLIALGAAIGAPLRYLVDRAVQARHRTRFPWGILTVNVAGSFLLGVLVAAPVPPAVATMAGTGFCGALTTYSTFSHDTMALARTGAYRHAVGNVAANLIAGLGAAWVGMLIGGLW